jgi:hypothetical protein
MLHRACVNVNLIASNALLRRDPTIIHTNIMVIECALSSGNAFLSGMSPVTANYRGRICDQVVRQESHEPLSPGIAG